MWCHHSENDRTKEVGAWRDSLLKTPEESPRSFWKGNTQVNKTFKQIIGELKKRMDSVDIYISDKKCQVKEITQRTEQKQM